MNGCFQCGSVVRHDVMNEDGSEYPIWICENGHWGGR